METTRHFVATVFMVNDSAVALHDHKKLDLWLAAGGHIDPKELPHEAALREAYEETGLSPTLHEPTDSPTSGLVRDVPEPAHVFVEDIDVVEDTVYHQHVDHIYYATVDSRDIEPTKDDEVGADDWAWFTADDLRAKADDPKFPEDAIYLGIDAIEAVDNTTA